MATTWCKTAGIPVFPPHRDPSGPCLLAEVLAAQPHRAELDWPSGYAGGIAHRLDVATSGAVWVADDPEELAHLRACFADKVLTKRYRFETARTVPWTAHHVTLPIAHDRRRKGRMTVKRGKDTPHRGRWYEADTRLRHLGGPLWEASITTGVMHQIRVHAAFVGLALRGDKLYGGGTAISPDIPFHLHHVGLKGAGLATDPVADPPWLRSESMEALRPR